MIWYRKLRADGIQTCRHTWAVSTYLETVLHEGFRQRLRGWLRSDHPFPGGMPRLKKVYRFLDCFICLVGRQLVAAHAVQERERDACIDPQQTLAVFTLGARSASIIAPVLAQALFDGRDYKEGEKSFNFSNMQGSPLQSH